MNEMPDGSCFHGNLLECAICDAEEIESEQCPYCDYNPAIHGYTSHYHCARCSEETGMMGHYRVIDDYENNIHWKGFTCDVNNERGAEWPEDDDEVF